MNRSKLKLVESSVLIGLCATNASDVIQTLGGTLIKAGYVLPDYVQDVLKREEEYPTGLPTTIPVAIPHASSGNCVSTALAIGILKKPVPFKEMGSPEKRLDVEMVFLLAIKNVQEQTVWLKNLMKIFKDKEFMRRLQGCDDSSGVMRLMTGALNV